MKVYLVRHARTRDAEDLLTQRHVTPIIINSDTLNEVEQIKNKIGEVDVVYCSPMNRAKETANLIFGDENYRVLDFIREYGTPEEIIGKPRKFATDFWEVTHKKDKMDINWEPEGGESFISVANRVEELYQFLLKEKETKNYQSVAIVGHGTFLRHFLLRIAEVPWTEYPQLIFDVLRKLKWDNLQVVEVEI